MITEDYVSFETAKLLMEKGFEGECDYWYSKYGAMCCNPSVISRECDCPSLAMVMKWLYKNYGIYITILQVESTTVTMEQEYFFYRIQKNRKSVGVFTDKFKEPEQAANSAIKYVLENLI